METFRPLTRRARADHLCRSEELAWTRAGISVSLQCVFEAGANDTN